MSCVGAASGTTQVRHHFDAQEESELTSRCLPGRCDLKFGHCYSRDFAA